MQANADEISPIIKFLNYYRINSYALTSFIQLLL